MVIHGTHLLLYHVVALPTYQEHAGGTGDEQEDFITHLELTQLHQPGIHAPLFLLGWAVMLFNDGANADVPFLHFPDIVYDLPERRQSFLPGFLGNVEQVPRSLCSSSGMNPVEAWGISRITKRTYRRSRSQLVPSMSTTLRRMSFSV